MLKSIKTIILLIIFVILAAIASIAFSNNKESDEEKSKINNITQGTLNFISSATKNISNFSFIKNNSDSINESETKSSSKININTEKLKSDFNEKINNVNIDQIKTLWQEKMGIVEENVNIDYDVNDLDNQKEKLEDFLSNIEKK